MKKQEVISLGYWVPIKTKIWSEKWEWREEESIIIGRGEKIIRSDNKEVFDKKRLSLREPYCKAELPYSSKKYCANCGVEAEPGITGAGSQECSVCCCNRDYYTSTMILPKNIETKAFPANKKLYHMLLRRYKLTQKIKNLLNKKEVEKS